MAKGNEILLYLMAENSDLKAKLAESEKAIKSTAKKTEESSSNLSGILKKAGALIVAYFGTEAIKAFAKLAGEIDSVSSSFYNLTSSAKGGGDAVLKSMKQASAGMMGDFELMKQANLAIQLMGDDVIEQLPKMLQVARAAARASGQDLNFMMDSLVRATGRQSVLVLDNLGISSATASQKMAQFAMRLGKTTEQLSDAEKKQAFFYAAMSAGQELIDKVGLKGLTLGERLQVMSARSENFKHILAEKATPALVEFLDTVTSVNSEGGSFAGVLGKILATLIYVGALLIETFKAAPAIFKSVWQDIISLSLGGVGQLQGILADMMKTLGKDDFSAQLRRASEDNLLKSQQAANKSNTLMADADARWNKLTGEIKKLWTEEEVGNNKRINGYRNLGRAVDDSSLKVLKLSQYFAYIQEEEAAEVARLQEEARDMVMTMKTTMEQRAQIHEAYLRRQADAEIKHTMFLKTLQEEWVSAIKKAMGAFETATKSALKESLFGKGGWAEWKKAISDMLQNLVVDILYAIAKALVLQAIFSAMGGPAGMSGGFFGGIIRGLFEKGRVPSFSTGRVPVLQSGVPSDHFLAYIGTQEAVVNKQSTLANLSLLKWMNDNPGRSAGEESMVVHTTLNLDGKTIAEVTDVHRKNTAQRMGTTNYPKRSVY